MNALAIADQLRKTRILFVEDRPETLKFFIKELVKASEGEVIIDEARDLPAAVEKIRVNEYEMVVIDLHLPGELPDDLQVYSSKLEVKLNSGQTLGLWIHDKFKNIAYIYLSAVPDVHRHIQAAEPAEILVLNKLEDSPREFPQHVASVLHGHSHSAMH